MKYLFLFFVFIPSMAMAQFWGVKGGVSFSNSYVGKNGFLTTTHYGITYLKFNNDFYFSLEPTINQKGYFNQNQLHRVFQGFVNVMVTEKLSLTCIELPIIFGWMPVNKKIIGGIYFGFAPQYISKSIYYSESSVTPRQYFRVGLKSNYNLDALAGITTAIKIKENWLLSLNVRFGSNIFDSGLYHFYYISPAAGISYKFKKK